MNRYWVVTWQAFVVVSALLLIVACAAPATPAATGTEPPAEAATDVEAPTEAATEAEAPAEAASEAAAPTETEPPVVPTIDVAPSNDCAFINDQQQIVVESCDAKAAERSIACNDIVPFNGDDAYAINDGSKPIGWTLGVNFSDAAIGTAGPLGCLRLYLRDEDALAYVPIDNGGILFDTCTVEGDVPINEEAATFCAASDFSAPRGVRCGVNLDGWLRASAFKDYLGSNYPDATEPVTKFVESPNHQYENFAMIAKASWQEKQCALDGARLPVVRYVHAGTPLSLALTSTADRTLQFDATCAENWPSWDESGDYHWMWYNVALDATHTLPHVTYDHQRDNEPVESCDPGTGDATVDFFIGPAELWIGFDLDPDLGTDESFMGDLDGILIDPFDSKPPVASIKD